MNKNKFYITTTLPYVNATPHIGHALEFIQADIIARYKRKKLGKENVFFNLGTDEHGSKIHQKSQEEGISTQEFVDKYSNQFKDFCKKFDIEYDFFYRTSADYHKKHVYKIWNHCLQKGDIYKKKYSAKYCVGCEEFKTEKDLINGKCPIHQKECITISEENYFFAISKYKEKMLEYLEKNPNILSPKSKINELKNFVKDIQDISISRRKEKMPWGIEVPNDNEQVIYVWFDALTNYIGTIDYASDKNNFEQWRPGIQIFGPDNLRFQGGIWQGMLAGADLDFSKKLLMHGYILDGKGQKMSKSLGNVVSPFEQLEKYGSEYIRFYLGAYLNTFGDGNYQEEELKDVINSRLADNFGNLLSRVVNLANKKGVKINDFEKIENEFKNKVDNIKKNTLNLMDNFELSSAFNEVHKLAILGNGYINDIAPWEKNKDQKQIQICLNNLSYLLSILIDLYEPVIPKFCYEAKKSLENIEKIVLFKKLD
ncbi:methionine--tRNA ligase [Candidatus Vampirococcus lugosii]|uniref:methionine--tRNA ligase n=1 Tax=Candidatus Vampirococcus lugosii TaxID=2789015 RepID=A0ABS5QM73_9BACT|nr:methionine--tRNA ligase [Candidatus Vampirococcus lugosii]MBS8122297.1 Methionyl-tRNA synthetase [Candidatus Vampirococcus lugosii]